MWEGMPEGIGEYLKTHMGAIPEDARTEETIKEQRLKVCESCKLLTEGICRACGCYVYLRASVKQQKCPYRKWEEDVTEQEEKTV